MSPAHSPATAGPARVPSGILTPWLLVAANLVPVLGVLFWGWDVVSIVVLFWTENLIIGFFTVIKLIVAGGARGWFLSLFFLFHYGGFCAGHGFFIAELFDLRLPQNYSDDHFSGLGPLDLLRESATAIAADAPPMWLWGFLALFVSHGMSLLWHFFIRGERRQASTDELMFAPYKRIMVLHVTIILGALAIEQLGSPLGLLILLVVLKAGVDLASHLKEHQLGWRDLFRADASGTGPVITQSHSEGTTGA